MRRVIQASIAELEDGAALLKDYSWLMKVGCDIAALTMKGMQGRSERSLGPGSMLVHICYGDVAVQSKSCVDGPA